MDGIDNGCYTCVETCPLTNGSASLCSCWVMGYNCADDTPDCVPPDEYFVPTCCDDYSCNYCCEGSDCVCYDGHAQVCCYEDGTIVPVTYPGSENHCICPLQNRP